MWLRTVLRAVRAFAVFAAFLIPFYVIEYLDGGWKAITDPEFTKNVKFYLVLVFFIAAVGTVGRAMFGSKEK
jgi:uncharacterized membrane protein YfhO